MTPDEAFATAVEASCAGVSAIFVTASPGEMLRAALASLRASGYAVVPVEPTEEMVGAVLTYHSEATGISYEADFVAGAVRATLAAAPKFPPEPDHG